MVVPLGIYEDSMMPFLIGYLIRHIVPDKHWVNAGGEMDRMKTWGRILLRSE